MPAGEVFACGGFVASEDVLVFGAAVVELVVLVSADDFGFLHDVLGTVAKDVTAATDLEPVACHWSLYPILAGWEGHCR